MSPSTLLMKNRSGLLGARVIKFGNNVSRRKLVRHVLVVYKASPKGIRPI